MKMRQPGNDTSDQSPTNVNSGGKKEGGKKKLMGEIHISSVCTSPLDRLLVVTFQGGIKSTLK